MSSNGAIYKSTDAIFDVDVAIAIAIAVVVRITFYYYWDDVCVCVRCVDKSKLLLFYYALRM